MVIFFYPGSKERTIVKAIFYRMGKKTATIFKAVTSFFLYLGHLTHNMLFSWRRIAWRSTVLKNLDAGANLVVPLVFASVLIGFSLTASINYLLAQYGLQNQVLLTAQNILIRNIAPLLIGFVLCVNAGLALIDTNHPSLHKPPHEVMTETIIPLIISINGTALLLYVYIIFAFFLTIIGTFNYFIQGNTTGYLLKLEGIVNPYNLLSSLANTVLYATLAGFLAGHYYYAVSMKRLSTQKAVSLIISRGLFWLVAVSVFFKYFFSSL